MNIFDTVFGNSGPTILEEYQRKVEESSKELSEVQLQLSQLQSDNQQLIEQSVRDTQTLEGKEVELERQRRQVANLTKEVSQARDDLRKAKSSTPATSAGRSSAIGSAASARRPSNPGAIRRAATLR